MELLVKSFTINFLARALAAVLVAGFFLSTLSACATYQAERELALRKLALQPITADPVRGYRGIIVNLSKERHYNFIISGPEQRGFLLAPGESKEEDLIPGTYSCAVFVDGQEQKGRPWIFHVTSQTHYFMGRYLHWYVFMK
jgi:hypothetical protein